MAKYLIGNIKGPKGDRGEAGPTYTAGTGIDITNNVISATGSGGITTETDPVFSASPAANITTQNILDWNAKSDFDGDYNDLTNKPDLSVYATTTALGTGLARKQDTLTAGTNITIENNVISATGGSGGSSEIFEYDGSAEAQASLLELFANGTPPNFIKDKRTNLGIDESVYSYIQKVDLGTTIWFKYGIAIDASNSFGNVLRFSVPSDYSTITALKKSERKVEPNVLNISWANTTDFPSATDKSLGHLFQAIGKDYAKKTEIPTPDGTTITESNGVWSAVGGGSAEDELPSFTSGDAGKVLTVNSTEDGVEWTTPASGGSGGTAIKEIKFQQGTNGNIYVNESADLTYLTNCETNGFENYPWKGTLYSDSSYTEPIGSVFYSGVGVYGTTMTAITNYTNINNSPLLSFTIKFSNNGSYATPIVLVHSQSYLETNFAMKSEVPTPDGTTITNNNGVWSAVGGGTTYTAGTGIDITNGVISSTVTDTNTTYTAGAGVVLDGATFQIDESWLTNFVNNIVNPTTEETITLETDSNNPTSVSANNEYVIDNATGDWSSLSYEYSDGNGTPTNDITIFNDGYDASTGMAIMKLRVEQAATGNYTIHVYGNEEIDPETGAPLDPPVYMDDYYFYITVVSNS